MWQQLGPSMQQRMKLCRMAAVGAKYAATDEAVQDGSSWGHVHSNREAGEDGSNGAKERGSSDDKGLTAAATAAAITAAVTTATTAVAMAASPAAMVAALTATAAMAVAAATPVALAAER